MPPKPPAIPYTSLQQDRQARNRPSHSLTHPSATSTTAELVQSSILRDETFEARERRHHAAMVLESNEMLIWFASSRNESVPQTRLHFEKVLAGFEDPPEAADWADDYDNDTEAWEEEEEERLREKEEEAARVGTAGEGDEVRMEEIGAEPAVRGGAGNLSGNASVTSKSGGGGKKVTSPRSKSGRGKGDRDRERRKDGKRRSGGGAGGGQGSSTATGA